MVHYQVTIHGVAISISDKDSAQAEALVARFPYKDSSFEIETVARFVNFAATENTEVAVAAFQYLHQKYCSIDNIHVVVQQLKLTAEQAQSAVWLLDVYRPLLADFVAEMAGFLLVTTQDSPFTRVYNQPIDLMGWLLHPESRPSMELLAAIYIASPILALIQLMHLMVLYKTLRVTPGELSQSFKSRHCYCGPMIPTVTDEKSFYAKSKKVLGTLIAGSYAIQLLSLSSQKLIAQFNSCYLSPTDHVYLALINTFDLFVVTGRLKVVVQFVQFLRQRCAESSASQVADISYVNSSIVTHCHLLQATGELLPGFVTERDWSYNCGDTQVIPPVKVNGVDISSGVDLDEMVAHVICTRRFDWPSTLKGADATHIVDFSPGGFGAFARLARGIVDGSGADIFQRDIRSVVQSMDWRRAFSPRLVQVKSDNQIHINSPMFHALGRPPVMVSTVEPSTTSVQLVAAAINAGYHAELSTTGITSTGQLQKQVADLVQLIEPGQDIALCCDYSNQEQWEVLFPEILRMRQAGQPITAAATDIIAGMRGAGLRHITLKAATLADIRATIAISKVDRTFPVILQWMGGRNGGYHSPILDTYSLLRFHRNIVLVAGSGIGDADTAMQYMSGSWSVPFGRPPMPFDGVAIGSCIMVAKESDISDATKQLIAGTAGVGPNEWMDTYSGVAGGVTSITGENGKPMHVIATRAALFAADKQTELLQQKGDSIVQRLNSDYVKPWFSKKADGSVAELQDMTYSEVIRRMIELMYVDDKSCWIDSSLGRIVYDFAKRVEDRFSGCVRECIIRHQLELDDNPLESIRCIERLMATEDIQYFIMLCKRSGQSPDMWMLQGAVSLSANSDYAPSHDAQRQLIPHGPDMLDGIYTAVIQRIQGSYRAKIPAPKRALVQSPIIQRMGDSARTYALPADAASLPELDLWLDILAGPVKSWLRAILTSLSIVQNDKFVANGVRRIMEPRAGQSVTVSDLNGMPQKLEVHGNNAQSDITLRVVHSVRDECFDLVLKYLYCPSRPAMPIVRGLYFGNHYGPNASGVDVAADGEGIPSVYTCQPFVVTADLGRSQCCRSEQWNSDMFDVIHLYNHVEFAPGASILCIGDVIDTDFKVLAPWEPLATMEIGMLFRGHEADAGSAFEYIEKSTSHVVLRSAADISVLQSRQWVTQVDDLFATLAPGSTLEFSLDTRIYLQNERTKKVHIASIEFDSCNVVGNPVQSYLDKYSEDIQEKLVFENGGNPVLPVAGVTTSFQAPTDCWKYSHISGDYNPIHHSAHIASYVGLPGPIIHGMWTSAATRAVVEKYVACGDPERFRLVFPGDCLDVELKHVGMEDGLMLLEGKTINQHGEAVMAFAAKIDQPKTSYIFTWSRCTSSSAAKDVWIRADAYMKTTYGVSLLKIVRENPLSYQVRFSGATGEQIRDNYMGLTRQVVINYVHRSANGLLNSTLFTQPIQTVMSLAHVADMRSKGLIQSSAMFAGHSLGEIGSTGCNRTDSFVRGLLLHASVERDDQGRSQYAMVSVNPSKVVAGFDERSLLRIVKQISKRSGKLLEVINYNVTDQQYVVTGHTSSLAIMGLGKATLITECGHKANATGQLANGIATTVISGVDLLDSVDTFRRLLAQKLTLCGRYIPNMTGSAFEVSREYFSMVYDVQALANWDDALALDQDNAMEEPTIMHVYILETEVESLVANVSTAVPQSQLPTSVVAADPGQNKPIELADVIRARSLVDIPLTSISSQPWDIPWECSVFTLAHCFQTPLLSLWPGITCVKHMDGFFLLAITMEPPRVLPVTMRYTPRRKELSTREPRVDRVVWAPGRIRPLLLSTVPSLTWPRRDLTCAKGSTCKHWSDITNELGDGLTKGTQPLFDKRKSRHLNSYWNWVRQDVFDWINRMILDGAPSDESVDAVRATHMFRNRSHSALIEMLEAWDINSQYACSAIDLVLKACVESCNASPLYRLITKHMRPCTRLHEQSTSQFLANIQKPCLDKFPPIFLRERSQQWTWVHSEERTRVYFGALNEISENGLTFAGTCALITGCSERSLALGLLEGLLSGGAKVVVTTSHYCLEVTRFYENVYRRCGGRGSQLVVVPFNQGSAQDVESLLDYIYSPDGLAWDLDYVLPFAAIPETGRDATNIGSQSELAFRIMLTNVVRMIGAIKTAKVKYQCGDSPALVILPNSPNKGVMGDDGLYSAAKMALLSIYDRWHAEPWSDYVSVAGIDIGWHRMIYEGLEKSGLRTYSRDEMAFCIFGLMTPTIAKLASQGPVDGNFTGGVLSFLETRPIYFNTKRTSSMVMNSIFFHVDSTNPLANHKYKYPRSQMYDKLEHLHQLEGMINLDKVVVVTGFGEVGPFGNSTMRWEMEAHGEFLLEGCTHYTGWVDAKSNEPVHDMDVKARYEPYILEHTGIRLIEPELHDGYDPLKKEMMPLNHLRPVPRRQANFKRGNGDSVDIWENADGSWSVKFLKGAVLLVPKALRFDRCAASQLPT
ncbi:hypothetical protein DL89DRAFT_264824, partial [Linderina pennispora]